MSELSRRDFLKVGTAGLVAVGTSSLWITEPARATQCRKPQAPERQQDGDDYYIVCPSDAPEANREYSALIHVKPEGPEIIYEGVDYYPFDGTYYLTQEPRVQDTNYFLTRAICTGYDAEDTPEYMGVGGPGPLTTPGPHGAHDRGPLARPPQANIRNRVPHHSFEYSFPSFSTIPTGATLHWVRLSLRETDMDGEVIRPANVTLPGAPNPNVWNYVRQPRRRNTQVEKKYNFNAIFGLSHRPINVPSPTAMGYNLHVEVMYDFGDGAGKNRYRGTSSSTFVPMY